MSGCCFDEQIPDGTWRTELCVCGICRESEQENDDEDDKTVRVVRNQSGFETAKDRVQDDTDWDEKAASFGWYAGEGFGDGTASVSMNCDCDNPPLTFLL